MNRNIIKIVIGLMMIATVIIGYMPEPEYVIELTCISNTLGGLLLLTDGICNLSHKNKIISYLYINVCVCILTVFLVCAGSLTGIYHMNYSGAFFFLHAINPIAFITCYMVFCDERGQRLKYILTAPIFILVYLLFDYIRCQFIGEFVYGFVEPEFLTVPYAAITGVAVYIIMCLFAVLLLGINKFIHRKSE